VKRIVAGKKRYSRRNGSVRSGGGRRNNVRKRQRFNSVHETVSAAKCPLPTIYLDIWKSDTALRKKYPYPLNPYKNRHLDNLGRWLQSHRNEYSEVDEYLRSLLAPVDVAIVSHFDTAHVGNLHARLLRDAGISATSCSVSWREDDVWFDVDWRFFDVRQLLDSAKVVHAHSLSSRMNCNLYGYSPLPADMTPYMKKGNLVVEYHGTEIRRRCEETGGPEDAQYLADAGVPVLISTPDLYDQVPFATWIPNPASPELDKYVGIPKIPGLLVHAPNRRSDKGTDEFLKAMQGTMATVEIIEQKPQVHVYERMSRSQMIMDQMKGYSYCMCSVQGGFLGNVCICSMSDQAWNRLQKEAEGNVPILNLNFSNVRREVDRLVDNPADLETLGRRTSEYMRRMHRDETVSRLKSVYGLK
jgi:hypothetical protein